MNIEATTLQHRVQELRQRRAARASAAGPLASVPGEGQVFRLDGSRLVDVAAVYLELGQRLEPTFGYYGACLDSLDDCLSGGIGGVCAPFQLTVTDGQTLANSLNWQAWFRYSAVTDFAEGSPEISDLVEAGRLPEIDPEEAFQILRRVAAGEPITDAWAERFDLKRVSFWESLVALLQRHGVNVVMV
ncbi:barstar family protein [Bremerella cremea]|uniref:barstar family protein n=1 Tax=Bremerella cremea TaxID=1031537 RepID=UPI0031E65E3A